MGDSLNQPSRVKEDGLTGCKLLLSAVSYTHLNQFVYELYDMVKSIKPEMKIGSAPIGTYKNISGLRVNAEAVSYTHLDVYKRQV